GGNLNTNSGDNINNSKNNKKDIYCVNKILDKAGQLLNHVDGILNLMDQYFDTKKNQYLGMAYQRLDKTEEHIYTILQYLNETNQCFFNIICQNQHINLTKNQNQSQNIDLTKNQNNNVNENQCLDMTESQHLSQYLSQYLNMTEVRYNNMMNQFFDIVNRFLNIKDKYEYVMEIHGPVLKVYRQEDFFNVFWGTEVTIDDQDELLYLKENI
ncbi:10265_t:CDS:1, partial [Acaulospora morrowiae]